MVTIRDRVRTVRSRPDGTFEVIFARHAGIYWVAAEDSKLRATLEQACRSEELVVVRCRGTDRRLRED